MTTPDVLLRRRTDTAPQPLLAMAVLAAGLLLSVLGYAAAALLLVRLVLDLL